MVSHARRRLLTALYTAALLSRSGNTVPGWLLPVLAALAVVAVVLLLISTAQRGGEPLTGIRLGVAVLAVLIVPAVASVLIVVRGQGAFGTPFKSARTAG